MHPRRCGVALTAASNVAAAPAGAANRFAAVGGTGGEPCVETNPCSIEVAINAGDGGNDDDVTLLGGVPPAAPYVTSTPLSIPIGVTVHGAAAGDFRQLPTSAGTIDLGTATGLQIGELDFEGQPRTSGAAPDIGADERQRPTTTTAACAPNSLTLGAGSSTCTATVTDTAGSPTTPTLSVDFTTNGRRHLQWRWFLHAHPGDPGAGELPGHIHAHRPRVRLPPDHG